MRKIEVHPGEVFSRFTIIKEVAKRGIHRYFLCSCSCGTVKEVQMHSLKTGTSKSCGCLHRELISKQYKHKGE